MMNNESDLIRNLSKNVKKKMAEHKISINGLAERTGLSFSEIRNIRDGKLKKLNAESICILANYFHTSPNQLLETASIPAGLNISAVSAEFKTSFFERVAPDFTFENKCTILERYDPQYEQCVVDAIHSFIEAHKLATGYYHEGINPEKTKCLTKDAIEQKKLDYIVKETLKKFSDKKEGKEETDGRDEGVGDIDKISAAAMAIKQLRELYGLTRKELGLRTRLGEDCIYRIESELNKKINYKHINLIARELLCTMDFILGESCDPEADKNGFSPFYRRKELIFRHVQLGHDLAYAYNYMDSASKDVVADMIHTLNTMYGYKKSSEAGFGKKLSNQEVFFREQAIYTQRYKNRGAHFYTQRYKLDERE